MRLNWFSSGSSSHPASTQYDDFILPHLSSLFEIQVWKSIDLSQIPWKEIHAGDLNIFVIDRQNPDGDWIVQLSQLAPGIMILLSMGTLQPPPPEEVENYRQRLLFTHGLIAVELFDTSPEEAMAQYPLPFFGLKKGMSLITHHKWISDELAAFFSYPVTYLGAPISVKPKKLHSHGHGSDFKISRIGLDIPGNYREFDQFFRRQYPEFQFQLINSLFRHQTPCWFLKDHTAETQLKDIDLLISLEVARWETSPFVMSALAQGIPCFLLNKNQEIMKYPKHIVEYLFALLCERELCQKIPKTLFQPEKLMMKAYHGLDWIVENHNPIYYINNIKAHIQSALQYRFRPIIHSIMHQAGEVLLDTMPSHFPEVIWQNIDSSFRDLN